MSQPQKPDSRKKASRKTGGIGVVGLFLIYFLLSIITIIAAAYIFIIRLSVDLPDPQQLEKRIVKQSLNTFIYSADGMLLRTVGEEGRKSFWAPYNEIPRHTIDAFLAAEDSRFFQHWGVSLPDIARAIVANFRGFRLRATDKFPYILGFDIQEGASTITQQLARTIFLDRKQTVKRKLREQIVAIKIEHAYSKSEILEFFLNRMEFGYPFIGIQAAAQGYFAKNTQELDIGESAMLAGLLQNPTRYNPRTSEKHLARATHRRNIVLGMMTDNGLIPRQLARAEMEKPIELASGTISDFGKAPYFVQYVEGELDDQYGAEVIATEGFRVYTTIDYRLQRIAEEALNRQLDIIQENYADHLKYKRPYGMTNAQARKDSLDKTKVQGALLAIDVKTGKVLAMVGGRGYDFFNRTIYAKRHAGSLFKPFVYTTALDNGWRTCDVIQDTPIAYPLPDGAFWEPENFNYEFRGPLSLRDGFKLSENIIAIKLMNDTKNRGVGPQLVIQYARKMGITTSLDPVPSLAIGTSPVTLLEMVSAYTIFPNHGIKIEPFYIEQIKDKNGTLIFRQQNGEGAKSEVLRPAVASLMITMFESVTKEGTASATLRNKGLGSLPCGGKTGTGNEYKDAWFIGFTPYIACGVWIGFDSEETTLGSKAYGTGATGALPIWAEFITNVYKTLGLPKSRFSYSDITTMSICKDSNKRATMNCPKDRTYIEYFIPGTEISEYCPLHSSRRRGF